MLSSLKFDKAKREEGFTLIELLVVVIIIGILAAIAIPVFLNQRESAWENAVESDLRNAAIQMEAYFTSTGDSYPEDTADLEEQGFAESENVTLTVVDSTDGFCLEAEHTQLGTAVGDVVYVYDTTDGGHQRPMLVGADDDDDETVLDCDGT